MFVVCLGCLLVCATRRYRTFTSASSAACAEMCWASAAAISLDEVVNSPDASWIALSGLQAPAEAFEGSNGIVATSSATKIIGAQIRILYVSQLLQDLLFVHVLLFYNNIHFLAHL